MLSWTEARAWRVAAWEMMVLRPIIVHVRLSILRYDFVLGYW